MNQVIEDKTISLRAEDPPQCSAHEQCAALNLDGDCCPTIDGTMLGCCGSTADQYHFFSDAYFPIDGMGFGNEGNAHNFHFCSHVHTAFAYHGAGTFSFTGDDDVWVFINNQLAVDLGGLHNPMTDTVDLTTFCPQGNCLADGNMYPLDVFHCERAPSGSPFQPAERTRLLCLPSHIGVATLSRRPNVGV